MVDNGPSGRERVFACLNLGLIVSYSPLMSVEGALRGVFGEAFFRPISNASRIVNVCFPMAAPLSELRTTKGGFFVSVAYSFFPLLARFKNLKSPFFLGAQIRQFDAQMSALLPNVGRVELRSLCDVGPSVRPHL